MAAETKHGHVILIGESGKMIFKLRPSDGHWRGGVESFLGRGNSNCKRPEVERAWLVPF